MYLPLAQRSQLENCDEEAGAAALRLETFIYTVDLVLANVWPPIIEVSCGCQLSGEAFSAERRHSTSKARLPGGSASPRTMPISPSAQLLHYGRRPSPVCDLVMQSRDRGFLWGQYGLKPRTTFLTCLHVASVFQQQETIFLSLPHDSLDTGYVHHGGPMNAYEYIRI